MRMSIGSASISSIGRPVFAARFARYAGHWSHVQKAGCVIGGSMQRLPMRPETQLGSDLYAMRVSLTRRARPIARGEVCEDRPLLGHAGMEVEPARRGGGGSDGESLTSGLS